MAFANRRYDGLEDSVPTKFVRSPPVVSSWQPGRIVFGISVAALGLLGLARGDFTVVWHPVPETLPGRGVLAYVSALCLIAGGLMIQTARFRASGGILLAILFAILGLPWLMRVVGFPHMIGTWVGYAEQLALALGGVMIALVQYLPRTRAVALCRLAFGLLQVIFGLGHFFSLPETVAMTPSWLPLGQEFWAIITGALHFVGGLAFIFGIVPVATAAVLSTMFATFALLVWLPAIAAAPSAPVPQAGLMITVALTGAMLALLDLLRMSRIALDQQRESQD